MAIRPQPPDLRPDQWATAAAGAPPLHAERRLLDGVERLLRNPDSSGWFLLVVRLSALPQGGPRAHHERIGAAVLEDVGSRTEGSLFVLDAGDLALLFRPSDGGAGVTALLARLFQADQPDVEALRSLWPLPNAAGPVLDFIRTRTLAAGRPRPSAPVGSARSTAIVHALARTAPIADITQRQTGVLLRPGHPQPLVPLYREVSIAAGRLEERIAAAGQAQADPFLFAHLCAQLDRRVLAALMDDIGAGGPLAGGLQGAKLHLNLTLSGILSDGFAAFAQSLTESPPVRIGIELPFVEAFAEPKAFFVARERLRLAGMDLVLDGITHLALTATSLTALQPSLVKLNWSDGLPQSGADLRAAITRLGTDRVVLQRSGSESAIGWGLSHGIQRFQGHYIDTMLAAERLRSCPAGAGRCSLRQCTDRAAATSQTFRTACLSHPLLDAATPRVAA